MNIRKHLILQGLSIVGSKIPNYLQYIRDIEFLENSEIMELQEDKLRELLRYSHDNVPYYRRLLKEYGVVSDRGSVNLDNFINLPFLTKDILRSHFEELKVANLNSKSVYRNTSGGSTGEPVEFLQDKYYSEWNISNKIYYANIVGKDIGEREIKIWGSERDIFEGTIGVKQKLINFIYNRKFLNSFKMSREDMYKYVNVFNKFKPKNVWTYVESIYELSKFIEKEGLEVWSPSSIVSTGGILYPEVRAKVEQVFGTGVYNQYGSREVGDMACECKEKEGMHLFPYTHLVEVVDKEGNRVVPGEEGEIVVTLLTNFSMPLIRYKIGDLGVLSEKRCPCGRCFPVIEHVTGREINHFINEKGDLIHGQYFIHLFYYRDWVKQFQVVQEDLGSIFVKIVSEKETINTSDSKQDMEEIKNKIKMVMGKKTNVDFEFCEEISPSPSGKYLYTISKIKPR